MKYEKILLALSLVILGVGLFPLDASAAEYVGSSATVCQTYKSNNTQYQACVTGYRKKSVGKAKCGTNTKCKEAATAGKTARISDENVVNAAAAAGAEAEKSVKDTCQTFKKNSTFYKICKSAYTKKKKEIEEAKREADSKPYHECDEVKTYFNFGCEGASKTSGGNNNPIFTMLITALSWTTGLVVLSVIGGIVYGGFLYTTAQDNSGQTQKGITFIVNSVIALILWMSAYVLMNFLIPGGLFLG